MIDSLLQSVYGPVEPAAVAYAIANDARQWLGCDRLSVLEWRKRRCLTMAVSGVDVVDRRSAACCALEDLATYVAMSGEELVYPSATPFAWQLEQTIDRHLHESPARQLLAIPLHLPLSAGDDGRSGIVGVLVVEQFTRHSELAQLRAKLSRVEGHLALALGRALAHARAPLAWLSKPIQRWQESSVYRRVSWTAIPVALTIGLLLASVVSVEYRVPAVGELQPVIRRDIFALEEAVVDRLLVQHGDSIKEGQLLVELTQSELEYTVSQLDGQLRTTQQQLQAVVARRWKGGHNASPVIDENQLAAEQERLEQTLEGLTQQRNVLRRREAQLQLRSPVAGEIVTWNVNERLLRRPVRRGQRLLSVVDRNGPWVAELNVADRDIRHVVLAQRSAKKGLRVTFLLATDPDRTYHGEVFEVAGVTQGQDEPSVRVKVHVQADQIHFKRPGATLVARIHCGRRSLIYTWFHDVWDLARTHLWW